jgi:hypothetical protein
LLARNQSIGVGISREVLNDEWIVVPWSSTVNPLRIRCGEYRFPKVCKILVIGDEKVYASNMN